MSKKIIHLREDCIGCGNCVEYAPEYWRLSDEDGKVDLIASIEKRGIFWRHVEVMDEQANQEAADSCPVNVIQIR